MEDKYLKVIEALGEVIMSKEQQIQFQTYEIENLKRKLEQIEQYIECYTEKTIS